MSPARILRMLLSAQGRGVPLVVVIAVAAGLIFLESGDGGGGNESGDGGAIAETIEAEGLDEPPAQPEGSGRDEPEGTTDDESGDGSVSIEESGGIRGIPAQIERIVDGDTAIATVNGREERLRYIGIDTPESVKPETPVECYGKEAAEENARLVEGREVILRFDAELRDPFGRLLVYVYAGGEFVNAKLVEGGFAETIEIQPNTDQAGLLNRLESEAAAAGRGLWGAC